MVGSDSFNEVCRPSGADYTAEGYRMGSSCQSPGPMAAGRANGPTLTCRATQCAVGYTRDGPGRAGRSK